MANDREVGTITGRGKKDTSYGGLVTSDNSSSADNRSRSRYSNQESIIDNYTSGTLLTSDSFDSDILDTKLTLDIAQKSSGNYDGYLSGYDDILGDNDPTSFLKAYRGYVDSRGATVQSAQTKSKTFLTGEI